MDDATTNSVDSRSKQSSSTQNKTNNHETQNNETLKLPSDNGVAVNGGTTTEASERPYQLSRRLHTTSTKGGRKHFWISGG